MKPDPSIAILDACVLYRGYLRSFLIWLALEDLFQAKWTETIHEEWISNLCDNRPDINLGSLHRTRDLMNSAINDCLVKSYESLIDDLNLPDLNDRHVLAAAIKSKASTIVTFNLRDFPDDILSSYGIQAQHPDDFILRLISIDSYSVCEAVKKQLDTLRNPPLSLEELINFYANQELVKSTAVLRTLLLEVENP
jgi:hypothetical protein